MAPQPSAPSESGPIRAQYSGHVICPDQSEAGIILEGAPPPYSEVNKRPSLSSLDDGIRRRRVKKARRRVRNIKIGASCLVIVLFLMGLV